MQNTIDRLRELAPSAPATLEEDLDIAERQAALLLRLSDVTHPPILESMIADVLAVTVEETAPLPHSSETVRLADGSWLVRLDGADPLPWRRWNFMCAVKSILDDPLAEAVRQQLGADEASRRAVQVADAFAACVLLPRNWVEQVWNSGAQEVGVLASFFEVSLEVMRLRLVRLGLLPERDRNVMRGAA